MPRPKRYRAIVMVLLQAWDEDDALYELWKLTRCIREEQVRVLKVAEDLPIQTERKQ